MGKTYSYLGVQDNTRKIDGLNVLTIFHHKASNSLMGVDRGPMIYGSNGQWVNETHSQYSNNLLIKPTPLSQWLGLSTLWNFSFHFVG